MTQENRQWKEHRQTGSPDPKKFKDVSSARKNRMTVFLECNGLIHGEIFLQGSTINPETERQIENLRKKLGARPPQVLPGKRCSFAPRTTHVHTHESTSSSLLALYLVDAVLFEMENDLMRSLISLSLVDTVVDDQPSFCRF
ncbi:hypothetical protein ElyMa_001146300 [Elysia marginata]|uniref:Uncharacterized protein n=1 Tax=Elysia marginata TaxID=1093978 RepID=A0AAV4I1F0_9GAST|nr:hypothetical protein ElyMa_001146300 [Elysia marginata]